MAAPDRLVRSGPVHFRASDGLAPWLARHRVSLVITTYEVGKLLLISSSDGVRLSILDRTIPSCMGLAVSPDGSLWVAARGRLLRFGDAGPQGVFDRRFLPRVTWYTGDIDAHDVVVDAEGPVIVATAMNALVRPSERRSFEPLWWPPFLSGPVLGDRCHLNGAAVDQGRVVAVTLLAVGEESEGWRSGFRGGGELRAVPTGEVLAAGLAMPHSPRVFDGDLWLHESALGRLVRVRAGEVEPIVWLPGFSRGLSFHERFAIVGISRPRRGALASDLPVMGRLAREGVEPKCGLRIVDIDSRKIVAGLDIGGTLINELYDVAVLAETRRPHLVGFRGDDRFTTFDLAPPAGG